MSDCLHGFTEWKEDTRRKVLMKTGCPSCMAERIHEASEIFAGMDGFKPETAPEGYCLRILQQMYTALQEQDNDGQ